MVRAPPSSHPRLDCTRLHMRPRHLTQQASLALHPTDSVTLPDRTSSPLSPSAHLHFLSRLVSLCLWQERCSVRDEGGRILQLERRQTVQAACVAYVMTIGVGVACGVSQMFPLRLGRPVRAWVVTVFQGLFRYLGLCTFAVVRCAVCARSLSFAVSSPRPFLLCPVRVD